MSEFINIGIDLGTTNSCIAEWNDDEVIIYMNNNQSYITPSIVYIHPNGRKMIGHRAKRSMLSDSKNVKKEFKREMGNNLKTVFPDSEIEMSPEELSAEILKSLLANAKRNRKSDDAITEAIITVPASFNTAQCSSTQEAGKLAGLDNVYLLQEPIAASLAYGVKDGNKNKNFIVYDLGGGTLDIALISTENNRLTVIDHLGDNFIGGKDIDTKIVEDIFFPFLKKNYNLPPLNSSEINEKYNILLNIAESAKINLSDQEETVVDFIDLDQDLDGKYFDDTLILKRRKIEYIIEDIIEDSLEMIQTLIKENKFKVSDISKILLVGGSTQIPFLRNKLKNELNVELNHSLNPITVVAQGAAIYASMTKKKSKNSESTLDELEGYPNLNLEYNNMTTKNKELVLGKFDDKFKDIIYEIKIVDQSGIWESGWINISNKSFFEVEVLLQEDTINEFEISARDNHGNSIEIMNNIFSIRHNKNNLQINNEPTTHSFFIEVLKEDESKLVKLFSKNTPLPVEVVKTFKAAQTIHPTDLNKKINIKIWEGEETEYLAANKLIGIVEISSKKLTSPLRENDNIIIKATLDRSQTITINATIEKNNENIIAKIEDYDDNKRNKEEIIEDTYKLLDLCYEIINSNEGKIFGLVEKYQLEFESLTQNVYELEDRLESIKALEEPGDKLLKINSDVSKVYKKLIKLVEKLNSENNTELKELLSRCKYEYNNLEVLVKKDGNPEEKEQLIRIKNKINQMEEFFLQDDKKKKVVKKSLMRIIDNIKTLRFKLLRKKQEFWDHHLEVLKKSKHKMKDQKKAEKLISEAETASEFNDRNKLESKVRDLYGQLTKKEINKIENRNKLPGLKEF